METMLNRLKRRFAVLSSDQILQTWDSGNEWDNYGPKVQDYLGHVNIHCDFEIPKWDFGNLKINDTLGSNSYSNFFFITTFD